MTNPGPDAVAILSCGTTLSEDGTLHPTVVLDVGDRPDIADLARVHALDGVGDIRTSLRVEGSTPTLQVQLTTPVDASFRIAFATPEHHRTLVEAAVMGTLLLATSAPEDAAHETAWLAVDIDGERLAEGLIAALGGAGQPVDGAAPDA